jgi:hypothetical protein
MKKSSLLPSSLALTCLAAITWLFANTGGTLPATISVPEASQSGIPNAEHIIFISCDGLRGDTLQVALTNNPSRFPNFVRMRNEGALTYRARTEYGATETIPNHSSMVTGRPIYEPGTTTLSGAVGHGQASNTGSAVNAPSILHNLGGTGSYSYKSSVFDVVHESGRTTAFFFSKDRIDFLSRSWNAANGLNKADTTLYPPTTHLKNRTGKKIDRFSPATGFPTGASAVGDAFVADANTHGLAHFTMLHFIDPDNSVHSIAVANSNPGATATSWETAVQACDTGLGKVLTWLDTNPLKRNCTTIIITADHGGVGGTSAHSVASNVLNYTIPLFIKGPGFKPNTDAYTYFTNRTDPGTVRSTEVLTTLPNQPLRNGDVANLALNLLGLPEVPGSYYKPILMEPTSKALFTSEPAGPSALKFSWPESASALALETSTELQGANWTPVTAGITTASGKHTFTTPNTSGPRGFYRLKRK